MKLDLLEKLNAARERRAAAMVLTDTGTGAERLILEADGYDGDPMREEIAARFRSAASGMVSEGDAPGTFFTVYVPPPRLIVIGAVHISQALAPMAKIAGFDMKIIDPRTAFATPERFGDVALVAEWPESVLEQIRLDPFTAVAALTHDPKIDDFPLAEALRSDCFYVGALGSRKTHGRRLERLAALGLDETALARIHAPIGLAIGAKSPAEIAVSILAEVIQALRARKAVVAEVAA
jgi:xanthine dehydrogenase accessory factor